LLIADKGPLMWGVTVIGLTVFAVGCCLALIVTSLALNKEAIGYLT
jgi:hypothetical protein